MTWDEFGDLVSGLNEQTALVQIAQIRTENDPEILQRMTPEQRAMRNEWQRKRAKARSQAEVDSFIEQMQAGLAKMFGD